MDPRTAATWMLERLRQSVQEKTPGNPAGWGAKCFSQTDEDGIIYECLRRLAEQTSLTRTFIEFGCGDGRENNTHALVLHGFKGLWIEGGSKNVAYMQEHLGSIPTSRLRVLAMFVTLETLGDILNNCLSFLGTEEVDFLSMDLDGNDYHFTQKCLEVFSPKLLCVEYTAKFPPPLKIVMAYNPAHQWVGDDYQGASLQAWVDGLPGYQLVCCNLSGGNAFFVRRDLLVGFPSYTVEELYQPPRYTLICGWQGHAPSLKWLRQSLLEDGAAQDRDEAEAGE